MITDYFDVAQMVLYLFWIFFFSLIIYLQRESNREGLPLYQKRVVRFSLRDFLECLSLKPFA